MYRPLRAAMNESDPGGHTMKAEQVKGALEKAAGKTQDFLGELTGDERLQMEGKARQSAGELQQRYGDVLDTCATYLQRRPRATLFTLAGLTFAVAWLIKRRS
jgi:uncharacterized protein YjbJ (UPF0337 family)